METTGYGVEGAVAPLPAAEPVIEDGRILLQRGPVTEWFVNDRRGLEQGYTLETPPAGRGEGRVLVELAVGGSLVSHLGDSGQELALRTRAGQTVLRYGKLEVRDAAGDRLPAELALAKRGATDSTTRLRILVDDSGAVYPVEIDPLLTSEIAKLGASDGSSLDRFGLSVAVSGDVAVVGAPTHDDSGIETGAAYVFTRNEGGTDAWDQVAELLPADGAAGDQFGASVAISGDTVIVGAPRDDIACPSDPDCDSGSAYVFARNQGGPDAWDEVIKLVPSAAAAGDRFGIAAAVSGDTALVGTRFGGSAYVFVRDQGGIDAWGEVAELTPSDGSGTGTSSNFGIAVALAGDTAVIGASTSDGLVVDSGAAYVFERNQGGLDAWGEVAELAAADGAAEDGLGAPVAIAGGTVLVGAPDDDHGGGTDAGAAYVFARNVGGADNWGETAKLTAADGAPHDEFGGSVTLVPGTAVVGASLVDGAGSNSGVAYVFERNRLGAGAWGELAKFVPADNQAGDQFGNAVAATGQTLIVGAFGDDDNGNLSGAAYVFARVGPNWAERAKPVAFDQAGGDEFGTSTAISGDTAVVGAPLDDAACPADPDCDSGAAYVFARNQAGADAWGDVTKLTASDGAAGDFFGWSVAIDGDTILVGAPFDSDDGSGSGAAYVFARNQGGAETWGEVVKLDHAGAAGGDHLGISATLSADTAVVGADQSGGTGTGKAVVFQRNEGGADAWGEVITVLADDGEMEDEFGASVAIHVDTLVVGAPREDADCGFPIPDCNFGAAYVFHRNSGGVGTWGQVKKLTITDPGTGDELGRPVAIHGDRIALGLPGDDDAGTDSGSVHVFGRNVGGADNWGHVIERVVADGNGGDRFGDAVAIRHGRVVVGAPGDDDAAGDAGSAYVVERNEGGPGNWGETDELFASDAEAGDRFGTAVGLNGHRLVAGAPLDDDACPGDPACDSGSVYVVELTAPEVDLSVAKTDNDDFAEIGGSLAYTIDVVNAGPDKALKTDVTDPFPAGIDCEWTCTPSGGANCTTGPVGGDIADIAEIPAGAGVQYQVSCHVDAGASGTLVNTASASPPPEIVESAPADNTGTDASELTVCGEAEDLVLEEQKITTAQVFTACFTVTGQNDFLVSPTGDVSLRAGNSITLGDGFLVEQGGVLTIEIDPTLAE